MRFIAIRVRVDIHVTDAVQVRQHRHFTLRRNPLDQPLATAGHHHVNVFRHGEQCPHRRPIYYRHNLRCFHRQPGGRQPRCKRVAQTLVTVNGFRTASQNHRIARLQAQRRRFDRHVRSRFINHAYDAQRHAHGANIDARWHRTHIRHSADRIGQRRHLGEPLLQHIELRGRQRQPVEQSGFEPTLASLLQVHFIRRQNGVPISGNRGANLQQRLIALLDTR